MSYNKKEKTGIKILLFMLVVTMLIPVLANSACSISLVSPDDSSWRNTTSVNFIYLLTEQDLQNVSQVTIPSNGSGNNSSNQTQYITINVTTTLNQTTCSLYLDDNNLLQGPAVLGQNSFSANISDGHHTWKVKCDFSESETRAFYVDTTAPAITLISPLNNSRLEVSGITLNTDFVFNSDDISASQKCIIYVNSNIINITESINYTVAPHVHRINNMLVGNYSWKIRCKDSVGNIKTSSTNYFSIEQIQDPNFDITFSKQTLNLGEDGNIIITANSGAVVQYLQITPPRGTAYIIPPISEFPFVQKLPQTNYSGIYTVFGMMIFRNQFYNLTRQYDVLNNLAIDVSGNKKINASQTVTLNMSVTGGIAPYSYYWMENSSESSKILGQIFSKQYNSQGEFTITAFAQDSFGNNITRSVTIEVTKYYTLTVLIKDSSNNPIEGVLVSTDDYINRTGIDGKSVFYLKNGKEKISAVKEGYITNKTELNITNDQEITLTLLNNDVLKPVINLETMENASFANEAMLVFSVNHNQKVSCDLLIAPNLGAFEKRSSLNDVNISKKQSFILNIGSGTYQWKIQCTDSLGNVGESVQKTFFVTGGKVPSEVVAVQSGEFGDFQTKLENALTAYEQFSKEQKDVAEIFNFNQNINNAIKSIERARIDILNINDMSQLSEEQRIAKINEVKDRIASLSKETVLGIQVSDSKTFIKYPENKEIETILDEYYVAKNMKTNKKSFVSANKKLQSELLATTNVYSADIEYFDSSKKATIVVRDLKIGSEDNYDVIEYIPKTLAESSSEITFVTKGLVIKEDPILEFKDLITLKDDVDGSIRIVYYFNKPILPEEIKNSDTLLVTQNIKDSAITGFSILDNMGVKINKIFLFIIPGIIIAVILLFTLKVPQKLLPAINQTMSNAKIFSSSSNSKDKLGMVIMINEAKDLISQGRIDDATNKYNAIQFSYASASEKQKKELMLDIMYIYNSIMISVINSLMDNCYSHLQNNMIDEAIKDYEQISYQYTLLSDDIKQQYYIRLSNLAEKINFHQLMKSKRPD